MNQGINLGKNAKDVNESLLEFPGARDRIPNKSINFMIPTNFFPFAIRAAWAPPREMAALTRRPPEKSGIISRLESGKKVREPRSPALFRRGPEKKGETRSEMECDYRISCASLLS